MFAVLLLCICISIIPTNGFHNCIFNSRGRAVRNIHVPSSSSSILPLHMSLPITTTSNYNTVSNNGEHFISFDIGNGQVMSFETGTIGRQAGGSVVSRVGDTMVYTTVCSERDPQAVDFTPLRVDYFARYSAVGQTVGAFHRRDSRGDDNEILVARLIDRPIRPMIADGWQHDTQILTWVLSYDKKNSPTALSICSASAAMCISEVPMIKPIAGVEVGYIDGEFIVNPTKQQMVNSTLQLTVAGTKEGILMIEGAANFLPEEIMIQGINIAHQAIGNICNGLLEFQRIAGKTKKIDTLRKLPVDLLDLMDVDFGARMTEALGISDKHKRGAAVAVVESAIVASFCGGELTKKGDAAVTSDPGEALVDDVVLEEATVVDDSDAKSSPVTDEVNEEDEASELALTGSTIKTKQVSALKRNYGAIDVKIAIKKLLVRRLRSMILMTGVRSDGRKVDEVRPISIKTNLLPGAHGSSLFTRGETQAIATATLGGKSMEAKYETLDENSSKKFYLQYRFPPSSVGEVGRVGGVSRREVGHGNLAERALLPAIPDVFPYTIRAESLITESCGSSSMATVCGCCLAMLDAGVPLKSSVAGVAMGLILGEEAADEPVILTDILGLEDALGTMDFKVAGNETGITTFQLDIKSDGLTIATLKKALEQARQGRLSILKHMKDVLSEPKVMKDTIPRILEFVVPPEALGKIIGPKGKTVQTLIETHGVENINLEDEGIVQVESFSDVKNEEVKAAIMKIVEEATKPRERRERGGRGGDGGNSTSTEEVKIVGPPPEEGMIYRDCEIKGIHNFGIFVEVLPGYEGLVHISELDSKKVLNIENLGLTAGQKIDVKYLGKNEKGQMRLSRKAVLMRDSPKTATGAATTAPVAVQVAVATSAATPDN